MKKGFTLVEVIISVTFICLISFILLLSIVYLSKGQNGLKRLNNEMTSIYEIEDSFYRLNNELKHASWKCNIDEISINNVLRYKKTKLNDEYQYCFIFSNNEERIVNANFDLIINLYHDNLLKIETSIEKNNYEKYYYLGDS